MNIANLPILYYCDKKTGHSCKCSGIATRRIRLKNRHEKDMPNAVSEWGYRCEEHAITPTAKRVVVESIPYNQWHIVTEINLFLSILVGKNIQSKIHRYQHLRVKYVKPNTGGVMCFQEKTNKWKFVYYNQISTVLS